MVCWQRWALRSEKVCIGWVMQYVIVVGAVVVAVVDGYVMSDATSAAIILVDWTGVGWWSAKIYVYCRRD